jgi:hypothetical protein
VAYGGDAAAQFANWQLTDTSPIIIRSTANNPLVIGYGDGGLASSVYTNANPSLTGNSHNPFIQGTAHLSMDIAGLTESTKLASASMLFGTTFTSISGGPPTGVPTGVTPTPLPAGVWGGISILGALGLGGRIRKALRRS